MNITTLSSHISEIDRALGQSASKAINTLLTARNWLIGFYIVEFEHQGQERGEYGKALTEKLAKHLNRRGLSARNLWLFRQFFLVYPQLGRALANPATGLSSILQSPTAESVKSVKSMPREILQSPIAEFERSESWQLALSALPNLLTPPEKLLARLSYTHLSLLLPIDDPLKRTFYEIEAIKGAWSVRELKRQITSLYYERSGMSANPEALSKLTQENIAAPSEPRHLTKDLYTLNSSAFPTTTPSKNPISKPPCSTSSRNYSSATEAYTPSESPVRMWTDENSHKKSPIQILTTKRQFDFSI